MLKWIARVVLALVVLALVGVGGLYAASEVVIRRHYDAPLPLIAASTDAGAVMRGAHLGRTHGCDGCHQPNLQGEKFFDDAAFGRLYPSNLTRALVDYTDAELARAIRQGVRRDGTGLWEMPSAGFASLSDRDTADIIAWLRTHPAAGEPKPKVAFGPLGRFAILTGKLQPMPTHVADYVAHPPVDLGPTFASGRDIARTSCSNCHGSTLHGLPDAEEPTPDLIVASGYDLAEFTHFMRTGIAPDGKEKGFMSEMAKNEFSHFTDTEIADLHAYLIARAERMPAA